MRKSGQNHRQPPAYHTVASSAVGRLPNAEYRRARFDALSDERFLQLANNIKGAGLAKHSKTARKIRVSEKTNKKLSEIGHLDYAR